MIVSEIPFAWDKKIRAGTVVVAHEFRSVLIKGKIRHKRTGRLFLLKFEDRVVPMEDYKGNKPLMMGGKEFCVKQLQEVPNLDAVLSTPGSVRYEQGRYTTETDVWRPSRLGKDRWNSAHFQYFKLRISDETQDGRVKIAIQNISKTYDDITMGDHLEENVLQTGTGPESPGTAPKLESRT